MFIARAKKKDSDELVKGWYCCCVNLHYVIQVIRMGERIPYCDLFVPIKNSVNMFVFIEIDPTTLAYDTGIKDKNGTPIFGAVEGSSGGDKLKNAMTTIYIEWNKKRTCWDARDLSNNQTSMLSSWGVKNDFRIIGIGEKKE